MEPRFLGCPARSLVTIPTKVILVPAKSIVCPFVHSYHYFMLTYAYTYLNSQHLHVYGVLVLPVVLLKMQFFWDVTPCLKGL